MKWVIDTPVWSVTFDLKDEGFLDDLRFAFGGSALANLIGGYTGGYTKIDVDPEEEMKIIIEKELLNILYKKHYPKEFEDEESE